MRYSIILLLGILSACSSNPKAENKTGLPVKIELVKNHVEGADITLTLMNTTRNIIRVPAKGAVSVWLDGVGPRHGQLAETVVIVPGGRAKFKAKFDFINSPKIYKKGVVQIIPQKVFRTCRAADADPEVAREEPQDPNRKIAVEVQEDNCNRPLNHSIRLEFE